MSWGWPRQSLGGGMLAVKLSDLPVAPVNLDEWLAKGDREIIDAFCRLRYQQRRETCRGQLCTRDPRVVWVLLPIVHTGEKYLMDDITECSQHVGAAYLISTLLDMTAEGSNPDAVLLLGLINPAPDWSRDPTLWDSSRSALLDALEHE